MSRIVPLDSTIAQFVRGGVFHVITWRDRAACARPGGGEIAPYTGKERLCRHCESVVATVIRERGTWLTDEYGRPPWSVGLDANPAALFDLTADARTLQCLLDAIDVALERGYEGEDLDPLNRARAAIANALGTQTVEAP